MILSADEAISNIYTPCDWASQDPIFLIVSKFVFSNPLGIHILKTQKLILAILKPMRSARAPHLWESGPHPFCFECRMDPKWETFCILETRRNWTKFLHTWQKQNYFWWRTSMESSSLRGLFLSSYDKSEHRVLHRNPFSFYCLQWQ